ncbi:MULTISPECIES: lytic transglycosylase domain-containing protein [unclassified Beijerinckia]|uniref:lytic transglycosylase domain-containing protein n=1 Tax=unclassified Beijerinckia TaxID=2638183 RepID=UPI00089BB82D|nr:MULTISPECIES: lytic transglycosylase domain-containing protein [unclassified Beijerinckia]MDH7799492.1 soluble lytic murein transglycosylase-like protein [Beijerinckia sp. GAS462]SED52354.1 Soluble lytic murein transglycosylase [Beijerinckia sp. 28-YEA-48]
MRDTLFRRGRMASAMIPAALLALASTHLSAEESSAEYFARDRAAFAQTHTQPANIAQPSRKERVSSKVSRKSRVRFASLSTTMNDASPVQNEASPVQAAPVSRFTTRRASPIAATGIHALVTAAAIRNGVPPALLHGVIRKESNYRCNAFNGRGQAHGVGQLKIATARSVGIHGSLYDCSNGVEAAARYLKIAIARGGAGCAGVSLYERGVYARPTCSAYGRSVMQMAHL